MASLKWWFAKNIIDKIVSCAILSNYDNNDECILHIRIELSKIDINNLHKLESKRIYWSDKLLELSKITPEDMAITKFEFKGKMLNNDLPLEDKDPSGIFHALSL